MPAHPSAYFDHAATTPVSESVVEEMLPWLTTCFGNPSGAHRAARDARRAVDEAREVVALELGVPAGEIVFCGSGTESDNLAIAGRLAATPGLSLCSAIEHHAVLDTVHAAGGRHVSVGADGLVDLNAFHDELVGAQQRGEHVTLVSLMVSNNEVGTIQPIAQVSSMVRELAPQAAIHVDAVNAMPWVDLEPLSELVDFMTVSAHKIGGPKGVAALRIRTGVEFTPVLHGGGQERGRRSGTHNVAGIVGFAAALVERRPYRHQIALRVETLRNRLLDELTLVVDDATATAPRELCTPSAAHVTFGDIEGESLLFLLDEHGVAASAGSSCSSGALEPSHVLLAMGVPRDRALGALRLTLGDTTTQADIDYALEIIPSAVKRLRDFRLEL